MIDKTKMKLGICHECGKEFELKNEYLIPNYEIWECPFCSYPNSKEDCIVTGEIRN